MSYKSSIIGLKIEKNEEFAQTKIKMLSHNEFLKNSLSICYVCIT